MYTKTTNQKNNWLMAIVLLAVVFTGSLKAQLSGTKNIPGDYATLALAITDLNTQGVGAGGVTLNLLSGNPETAPAGGYAITASGSLSNPITIQGNTNIITANASLTAGALNDAVFKIIGGDYITVSGFNMQENAANTATTAASNNMTEFGVALFYASTTDGAQNITIQTNTITLNRTYQNTFGIYANSTHNATAVTTASTATGALGGNHNLKIYSNDISNVNTGLVVVGPTAAADYNQGLDIGGTSASSGNIITNFGTTGTFSSFSNVSGTVNGMQIRNTGNYNVSYNSVASSNGGTTSGTLNGIFMNTYSNTPSIAYTQAINNNTVSLRSAVTAGAMNGINVTASTSFSTSTLSINNNDFNTFGHTVAGASGTIIFISSTMPVGVFNANGNTFTNISVNTTGNTTFISHNFSIPATGTSIISNNNIVTAYSKTGAGGTIFLTATNATSGNGSVNNYLNNNFSNITATGATAITGFNNTDGGTGSTKTITGNILNNWTGGTSAINCMNFTYWNGVSSLSNNLISNITGQSNVTGITLGSTANNATSISVSSNTLISLSSTGTGAAVTGIACSNTSAQINLNNNFINTLSSTGASLVSGITVSGSTNTNIFKNKIYDLSNSNTGGSVSGITSSGGTTNNIYNNIIGDLRTPNANGTNPLNGINLTGGTTLNISYNTVYLNAVSTGTLFGSSAISSNATPTSISLRNNIFINNSTPTGTAVVVAYRRSAAALTNYASSSNSNLLYAGTPSTATAIFYDGTAVQQTLADFKTLVGPTRDAASVTENSTFASTTGSNSNFLHFNAATSTLAESGAVNISGLTDDFDANVRQGNAGYTGTGTAPDIGADEFEGVSTNLVINAVSISPTGNQCTAGPRIISATITPGSSPLTAVNLTYTFDGTSYLPVAMAGGSFTSTSTWTATIPTATPSIANVTWTVSATDGTYSKVVNGTPYADEPASNFAATASVSPNPVCATSTATLTFNLLSATSPTYCTIAAATSTASYFNGFSTTGGIDNITNNTSGFSTGGYGNFTNLRASQKIGQSVNFNTILAGTTVGVAIWVDWNQNGTFDAAERVYNTTGYVSTASGSFLVPASAKLGVTRMRIFMDFNNSNPATPCGPFSSGRGEAEDYTFVVLPSTNLTYSWTDGVTTFTSSTNTSSITVNASATYTGTAYIEGCPLTSTVQVNMTPLPSAPIVSNSSQCGIGVPTSSVIGGANYNWYATPTSTTVLQTGSASNFTSSIGSTTTWYVTSVNGACESTPRAAVTTTVSIPDPVTANTSSSNLCVGSANTVTLTAVQTGTNNPYTFTWNASSTTGSGMPSSVTGTAVVVTPTLVGNYTYSVTATDGVCTTISTVTVSLNDLPIISNASATPTAICSGSSFNLNANSFIGGPQTVPTGYCTPTSSGSACLTSVSINTLNRTSACETGFYLDVPSSSATTNLTPGQTYTLSLTTDAAAITSVWFDWNRDGVFTASEWFQPFTSASTGSISVLVPLTANGGLTKMRVRSRLSGNTNGSGDACTSFGSGEAEDYTINVQTDNTGNYSWVWNPGSLSGNSLTTSTTNTTSSAVTKVYTVTATSTVTGCSNTATTSVLVNPLPTTPVATNASQCGVAVPTASVSGGVFYNWYATPTSTTNIQAGATSHYSTSISNTTTWYVTSFNGTCESSPRVAVTQSVTIPDAVSASSSATKLCVGGANTITLTATQTGTNSNAYVFTWSASPSAGSGISSSITGSVVSVTPSTVGNYVYNLSASDGTCIAVSSVSVSLNSVPSISTTATPSVICSGANVNLNAESINVAAGTASVGTQSSTGTTGTPYMQGSGIANDLKVQYLYTAAELNAAGIYAGNITDIRFNATAAGSGMINNFEIKMGTTATTSLTTAYDFPPSTVYGPYSYSVTLGQNIHTFDTPFNWDGVSNVIVEICHDAVIPAGVSSTLSQQTAANRVIYSNTATACGLATGNSTTLRPLIGFSGQVGTNVTSSLTWTWNPGAIPSNAATVTPVNTGSTAATSVYTISVNNAATTCSNTGTVGVLVNAIPTTPVVSNTTQCGVGIPTSSVSGGTSYNWYATPTSTTVLQSGTSTNFTTSISNTTSWYVTSVSTASCQSPRAQVTSSVTIPDAVTAAVSSASICPNTTVALIATNTGTTNTYSYTWTAVPASGSGITGSVSGSSVSISPSLSGNYVYSLTAVDGACTAVNTVSLNVFQTVATPTAIATPSVLCSGNSATLSLNSSANVALGSGTTTTQGGSGLSPYAQFYEGQRTQYLFKASELTAAGLSAGNITSMAFNVTTASATMTFTNYAIKMYHTTSTDLVSAFATNSSPIVGVFGPVNLPAPAIGVNTHNFATPFNWDGTSNVIIDICFENDPNSTGILYTNNTTVAANTVSGYTSVRGYYADNSSLCNTSNTGTSATSTARPNIIFKGNSLPGVTTIDWTTGVTSVGTGSVVSVAPTTTSTYTATLTDNHSCIVMSTPVTLTVNTTPTVSAVASNTAVCAGSPATLTASGATNYTWTSGGTSATENVTPTALTVYTVTGETSGCSSTATVSVDALAVPSVSVAASSSSLCSGNSTTLTASGATNYTWTSGGTTSTEVVTPSTTITYTVTGEATGCSGTATVAINVTATPTVAAATSNATVCTGNSATLTASGATNYTWTSGGTTSTESVTPTALTVYTVTGETGGCSSTATVSVDVNSIIPTVTVSSSNASVCSGSSATLTAGGATNYTWTSGGTSATEVVTPTVLTVYTVTGVTSGCSNTATISLGVNQTPTVSAVASQTLLCDDGSTGSSILTASSNGTSYSWSDGATTMTTVVTPSATTVYTITATGNGCSADAYVTVTVSNCNGIKDLASDEISIFPNPTNGNVTISVPASVEGNVSVEVYDAIGKLTIKENITNNMSNVNLSKLEDGMYMFKIINNNKTIKIGKIVKQ